jgi:hypothetical protein
MAHRLDPAALLAPVHPPSPRIVVSGFDHDFVLGPHHALLAPAILGQLDSAARPPAKTFIEIFALPLNGRPGHSRHPARACGSRSDGGGDALPRAKGGSRSKRRRGDHDWAGANHIRVRYEVGERGNHLGNYPDSADRGAELGVAIAETPYCGPVGFPNRFRSDHRWFGDSGGCFYRGRHLHWAVPYRLRVRTERVEPSSRLCGHRGRDASPCDPLELADSSEEEC